MASSPNIVSDPPLNQRVMEPNGLINRSWAIWFRDVYKRIADKRGNAIDDLEVDLTEIYETLAEHEALIVQNIIDIALNATNIAINTADIDLLEAKNLRDETQVETSVSETVDLSVNGLVKQTASDIETSFTGQVAGQTVTVQNASGGTNTLNITVEGVYLPKIYDGESFTMYYNGTDWDLR